MITLELNCSVFPNDSEAPYKLILTPFKSDLPIYLEQYNQELKSFKSKNVAYQTLLQRKGFVKSEVKKWWEVVNC